MDALIINGPAKLKGEVEVSGSKNSALPLLFASLLFDETVTFTRVPRLWDIATSCEILKEFGCEIDWNKEAGVLKITPKISQTRAPYELVKKMRASILALGPVVAKVLKAEVSLPGGCAIGARPVDFHIEAMKKMGVEIDLIEGYVCARASKPLHGAHITFPLVTVTGTENILMLASLLEEETIIDNAACEPEVIALGQFLKQSGVEIEGLGSSRIRMVGNKKIRPPKTFEIPFDRIEAGTLIAASVVTRNPLTLKGMDSESMLSVLAAFEKMGVQFEKLGKNLQVYPQQEYRPVNLSTEPYPGFPTDMQAQMMVCLCLANGSSSLRETIFENRFMHVAELKRMNARIETQGNLATIHGPVEFKGAPVMATDLRASASLVLAGLAAHGQTRVSRIYHLDRGYQRLDEKLQKLGADISRVVE